MSLANAVRFASQSRSISSASSNSPRAAARTSDRSSVSMASPDLRAELTRAGSLGYQAWLRAREQEDYGIMLPHLERNLELRRRYVACFEAEGDQYDVVLDDYEPGMRTSEVVAIFDQLKAALLPMMGAVAEADPI